MKVAIVHDYLKEFGGAERVVETLLEIWPDADVYTAIYSPKYLGPHRLRVEKWKIKTSFLQYFPFKEKLISYFRFIGPWIFKSFDLTKYDLVIVSAAGTYTSPNFVKVGTKTLNLCYCHTPPRYLYGYPTAQDWSNTWGKRVLRALGTIPMHFLRMADFNAAQKPDYFIANSKEVATRIQKFYRRDSVIIYPPVDVKESERYVQHVHDVHERSYYLAGGRLARPKRVDLAVKACTKLHLPLKVFGKEFAGYGDELREMAGPTVEFLGEVTDEERWKLMAGAKAYIFPAEAEDFGITPAEAMAVGTPVIAYRSGGVVESVIEGKTGVFFEKPTAESLIKAIKQFNSSNRYTIKAENCVAQARKFSRERFKKEINQFVLECLRPASKNGRRKK